MNILVEDIGLVVNAMRDPITPGEENEAGSGAPYYMYGHILEISNRVLNKNKDRVKQYQKYPLIALRLDTTEEVTGRMISYSLNILIIASTKGNYNSEERLENVFKPILYPLYEKFFDRLVSSGLFTWEQQNAYRPAHTKIDRFFWGTEISNKNSKNIFKDNLDAIEIQNLRLKSRDRCPGVIPKVKTFDYSFDATFK